MIQYWIFAGVLYFLQLPGSGTDPGAMTVISFIFAISERSTARNTGVFMQKQVSSGPLQMKDYLEYFRHRPRKAFFHMKAAQLDAYSWW